MAQKHYWQVTDADFEKATKCVESLEEKTAQTIWAAFRQHAANTPAGEAVGDQKINKSVNSDLSDQQKTTRPGRTRTYDQRIMSPLL